MRTKLRYIKLLIFLAVFSGGGTAYASFSAEPEAEISFPGDPQSDAGKVDTAATAVTFQMLLPAEFSGSELSRDLSRGSGPEKQYGSITSATVFFASDRAYFKLALLIDPGIGIEELLFPFHFFT